MKRELTHHREIKVRGPASPKGQERRFGAALAAMVELLGRRFKNCVLKELNQGTVDKFADGVTLGAALAGYADKKRRPQVGNFAYVYLDLVKDVRRRLERQFDDDRIDRLVEEHIQGVNEVNQRQLHDLIEARMGIDTAKLAADEGLTFTINALEAETAQWVKKLRDDTLEYFTANSLRAMTLGHSLGEIMGQFDDLVEKRKGHARMVARTQIQNFNSVTTKIRAQNLGLTEAEWVTAHDDRVRPSHQDREGKRFDLAKGLWSSVDQKHLLPGVDYNCRCTYMLIVPKG